MARKAKAKAAPSNPPKARRFDPLRAYGTVSPPERGAVFYQDGGYFNSGGALVFEDRPATPDRIVRNEVTTVDSETGEEETKVVETKVPVVAPGDPKDILKQWLKGGLKLNHMAARAHVKSAYARTLVTKEEIITFLVNEANLVPAEDVKV